MKTEGGANVTIFSTEKEIRELIDEKHVIGAEAVINALVSACAGQPWLDRAAIDRMLDAAYRLLEEKEI